jgi:hypothetical protein
MVAAQYRLLHHKAVPLYSLYQENQSTVQGCGFGRMAMRKRETNFEHLACYS